MTNVVKSNVDSRVTKANTEHRVANPKIRGIDVDTTRFRYNQSPVETPDGIVVVFTLPNSESFITKLLEVFVNGNQKIKDTEWEETGTTKITFIGAMATNPPESDESIKLNYIKTL